jgi:CheY-like chemotaxis protein
MKSHRRTFKVIFMDVSMPIMDGYAATKAIRQLETELNIREDERSYIIGLTGHCTEVYREKCFTSGMDKYSKCLIHSLNNL